MDAKVSTKTKTFQNLNKNCPLVYKVLVLNQNKDIYLSPELISVDTVECRSQACFAHSLGLRQLLAESVNLKLRSLNCSSHFEIRVWFSNCYFLSLSKQSDLVENLWKLRIDNLSVKTCGGQTANLFCFLEQTSFMRMLKSFSWEKSPLRCR